MAVIRSLLPSVTISVSSRKVANSTDDAQLVACIYLTHSPMRNICAWRSAVCRARWLILTCLPLPDDGTHGLAEATLSITTSLCTQPDNIEILWPQIYDPPDPPCFILQPIFINHNLLLLPATQSHNNRTNVLSQYTIGINQGGFSG